MNIKNNMTKFDIYVNKYINKFDIKDITKKDYITKITLLRNKLYPKLNTTNFLKNYEKIISFIETNYTNKETKKSLYKTILKFIDDKKKYKILYRNEFNKLFEIINENNKNNIINENMKNKWISFEEMRCKLNSYENLLKNKYKNIFLNNETLKLLNVKEKQEYIKKLFNYIIVYIYVYKPPLRNDYWDVKILYKNTLENKNENYFDIGNSILILNDFKNFKSMGKQQQILSENIYKLLKNWVEINNEIFNTSIEYLFPMYHSNLKISNWLNGSSFSNKIKKCFLFVIGIDLNINLLRKIYETEIMKSPEYLKMTNNEQDKKHLELLHSNSAAREFYQKKEV